MAITYHDLKQSIATEGYFISKKDIEINLDKWISGESNILLITGLSRSGKSTLAEEMTERYKNVHNIELDRIENTWKWIDAAQYYFNKSFNPIKEFDPILTKFFETSPVGKFAYSQGMAMQNISDDEEELHTYMNEAIQWILNYCKTMNSTEKVILEGIQIFYDLDINVAKNYPIIIKGTSMAKSFIRRQTHGYKTLRNYIRGEKELEQFRKAINKRK